MPDFSPNQSASRWFELGFNYSMNENSSSLPMDDPAARQRLKFYDEESHSLQNALPDGEITEQDHARLFQLAEDNKLFYYPAGSLYPQRAWVKHSDDRDPSLSLSDISKTTIDQYAEIPEREDLATLLSQRPVAPPPTSRPDRDSYVAGFSGFKLFMNRLFSYVGLNVFADERQRYDDALARYDQDMAYHNGASARTTAYQRDYRQWSSRYNVAILSQDLLKAMQSEATVRQDILNNTNELQRKQYYDIVGKNVRSDTISYEKFDQRLLNMFGTRPQMDHQLVYNGAGTNGNYLNDAQFNQQVEHGFDLPQGCKLSAHEAALVNLLMFNNKNVTTPAFVDFFHGNQVSGEVTATTTPGMIITGAFFHHRTGQLTAGILAAYDQSKQDIEAFQQGDIQPLADHISDGVRGFLNSSFSEPGLTKNRAGYGLIAQKTLDLFQNNPELLNACNLNEQEFHQLQATAAIYQIYQKQLEGLDMLAQEKAGLITLDPEQRLQYMADIALKNEVHQQLEEHAAQVRNSPEYQQRKGEAERLTEMRKGERDRYINANGRNLNDSGRFALRLRYNNEYGDPELPVLQVQGSLDAAPILDQLANPHYIEGRRNALLNDPKVQALANSADISTLAQRTDDFGVFMAMYEAAQPQQEQPEQEQKVNEADAQKQEQKDQKSEELQQDAKKHDSEEAQNATFSKQLQGILTDALQAKNQDGDNFALYADRIHELSQSGQTMDVDATGSVIANGLRLCTEKLSQCNAFLARNIMLTVSSVCAELIDLMESNPALSEAATAAGLTEDTLTAATGYCLAGKMTLEGEQAKAYLIDAAKNGNTLENQDQYLSQIYGAHIVNRSIAMQAQNNNAQGTAYHSDMVTGLGSNPQAYNGVLETVGRSSCVSSLQGQSPKELLDYLSNESRIRSMVDSSFGEDMFGEATPNPDDMNKEKDFQMGGASEGKAPMSGG